MKNWFHRHSNQLIAVNDNYHTEFTNSNRKEYHQMRFYQCSCGRRQFTTDKDKYSTHSGIEKARANWMDAGVVPTGSYHPETSQHYVKPNQSDIEQVDPLVKLTSTVADLCDMMQMIRRDHNLEAKYPKLKKSADNYKALFEKYKTFETLKGNSDD